MTPEWNTSQPIFRQVRDLVAARILDGSLSEGDTLPSLRQVAAEYRMNPLTVMKAYQLLVAEGLVESRRGLGMYVKPDARGLLLENEREHFLREEWPRLHDKIRLLGLKVEDLVRGGARVQPRSATRRVRP